MVARVAIASDVAVSDATIGFVQSPIGKRTLIDHGLRIGTMCCGTSERRGWPVTSSSAVNSVSTILGSAVTSSPAVRAGQVV